MDALQGGLFPGSVDIPTPTAIGFDVRAQDGGVRIGGSLQIDGVRVQAHAVVTHGHSDHIAAHRAALMTAPTARFYQARLPRAVAPMVVAYGEPVTLGDWSIELLPAGHILGSAMVRATDGTTSILHTGDFKLRGSLTTPPATPKPADILITETTFALPNFRFPPVEELRERIIAFAAGMFQRGQTPVFLGYSLGKSQEVAAILASAGIAVGCEPTICAMVEHYRAEGIPLPGVGPIPPEPRADMAILLCPGTDPFTYLAGWPHPRLAWCSGWAALGSRRMQSAAEVNIPLSDHADFAELMELVERVQPQQIYTHHGYAAPFARILQQRGFRAQPLPGSRV